MDRLRPDFTSTSELREKMPGPRAGAGRDTHDARIIETVKREVLRRIPSGVSPGDFFGSLIRRAIDEVLTLQSMRYKLEQLAPTEQTYIGTRVEILVREALDVGIGRRADAFIAGEETDIKWSRRLDWMIGPENLGTVCLGIGTVTGESSLSVGLFIPYAENLGAQNRDRKFTAGATFRRLHVNWIVQDAPLEANFIAALPDRIRDDIMSQGSAQARVRRLAELVPNTPIPRSAIRYVTNNKDDFMRRIREDASRRTPPLGDMVCLSWKYRKDDIARLGMRLKKDEFVFVERSRLR